MALLARLRRATALSSAMCRSFCSISSTSSPQFLLPNHRSPAASFEKGKLKILSLVHSSSSFHSSIPCSFGRFDREQDNNKIPEDEILFEGCDYNHWLITMDFPKDPKPSPEEMVETYVQTLAKVVGSVEEAKKKMYACSTTTYTGFQAVMTEEMSEKFRGLPGVVFILPDSYIDPVNKEYGGDKYDNGVITPRPPPFQYRRNNNNNNRRNTRYDPPPRYEQQRGPPMQGRDQNEYHQQMPGQGSPPNQYQGPRPGYGRQNYGPPGQEGSFGSPPGDRQQQQGFQPMYQGNPQMQQSGGGGYRPPQQGYPTMQQQQQQQQQGYPNVQQQQQGYPNVQQQQGYPNMQQQGYPTMPPQQQRYPDIPSQQENPRTRDGADYSGQMKHDLPGHDGRGYGN